MRAIGASNAALKPSMSARLDILSLPALRIALTMACEAPEATIINDAGCMGVIRLGEPPVRTRIDRSRRRGVPARPSAAESACR